MMKNRNLGMHGVVCSIVVLALTGCSNAARDVSNNDAPVAQVTLNMANSPAHVGTVLQARYQYSDADGDREGGTLKAWLRDGQPIEGADQDSYTVTAKDSGKKLHYRVTPAAASGKSPGVTVASPEITIENSAPSITNVVIGGSVNGQADGRVPLTVSYSFHDLDDDGEGVSTYEWRRNGIAIGSATEKTYTLTFLDVGKTITVAVKPFAHTGASPGLAVVSNSITVPAVALNVSAGLKQLRFSWAAVPGASSYRVSYSPAEGAGFVPLSTTSSNLTTTTYDWDIGVHRINWPKAHFMLEACDASNTCLSSVSISALNVMLGAIGYFKAGNTGAGDWFGWSVALSGDGNTLAVGAVDEDSVATGVGGNQADGCTAVPMTNCAAGSGAVYVYTRTNGAWSPQPAYVKASNTGTSDPRNGS